MQLNAYQPDDLVTVVQIGEALEISERSVWNLVKRHELASSWVPARGRWKLYRWGDVVGAYTRPQPAPDMGKAAA